MVDQGTSVIPTQILRCDGIFMSDGWNLLQKFQRTQKPESCYRNLKNVRLTERFQFEFLFWMGGSLAKVPEHPEAILASQATKPRNV